MFETYIVDGEQYNESPDKLDKFLQEFPDAITMSSHDDSMSSFEEPKEKIGELDLKDKPVAIFGLGDSVGYGEDFVDAMEELHRFFEKAGAKMVGYVPLDDYTFVSSRCLIPHLNEITKPEDGEKFCGLPVDEDSENEKTEDRVKNWCIQLKSEMGL